MKNVNENKSNKVKLIQHYIKDLSFENPQDISQYNSDINNNQISTNMNVVYEPYNNNFFSLIIKISFDCTTKENNKLCHLELDYFGFFKNLNENFEKKSLSEYGLKLIFPFAKEIVEVITHKGGSIPISLNDSDFNLIEN